MPLSSTDLFTEPTVEALFPVAPLKPKMGRKLPFRFLDLPAEVRHMVYEQLFAGCYLELEECACTCSDSRDGDIPTAPTGCRAYSPSAKSCDKKPCPSSRPI